MTADTVHLFDMCGVVVDACKRILLLVCPASSSRATHRRSRTFVPTQRATRECEHNHGYGFMWWLPKSTTAAAPPTSFMARGAGGNYIYIDPASDVVIVARWCSDRDGLIDKVLDAILVP